MDNKLTQDYKDNLYEKVLEKKARRTANRKRLASICVVFFIVACFATYGYTKYEKENYNNYFLTESENIYIDDEYEYFDDLGIKLEFINTDKDSITIGVNIKYEDIADYDVNFEKIIIEDLNNNEFLFKNYCDEKEGFDNVKILMKKKEKNETIFIFEMMLDEGIGENISVELKNLIIANDRNGDKIVKEIMWKKIISIEN